MQLCNFFLAAFSTETARMGEAEAGSGPAAQSGTETEAGKMPGKPRETEVATAESGRRRE